MNLARWEIELAARLFAAAIVLALLIGIFG